METILPPILTQIAEKTVADFASRGLAVATAESCTGGLVSAALTEISGSSAVFLSGYVTYSNSAKMAMLGVEEQILIDNGAVSQQTAKAMADGALERSGADYAVAITGVAGPGGGSAEKPVGTVMFALAKKGEETKSYHEQFGPKSGNVKSRSEIRTEAAIYALQLLSA